MFDSFVPMNCSPPASSVCGISQARILEWISISFSRGSSWPRDQTCISCLADRFFTSEPPGKPLNNKWNLTVFEAKLHGMMQILNNSSMEVGIQSIRGFGRKKFQKRKSYTSISQLSINLEISKYKAIRASEDEMAGWHHWCNGHELGQTMGNSDGQGGLGSCGPWDHRVGHDWVTEQQHANINVFNSVLNNS